MRQGVGYFPSGFSTPLRQTAPTLSLHSRALAAASRRGNKPAAMSQGRWDTLSSRLLLENHQSCLQTISKCSKLPFDISIT
ncbi:hypothetical protein DY000_02049519 [Brassica cretica]|uniref:Uncharacterized protein n=1 Tax=Brassica cretica TaxID=69181 RepID=A0ABQ7ERN2_BRACR|nr:hypothetical protein DY000_02049519 [Brassica cretica]